MDYPKTKYHVRGGGSISVTSAAQEKALGDEWVEVRIPTPVPAAPLPIEELDVIPVQMKRGRRARAACGALSHEA